MAEQQREFDWPRAQQLACLRQARLSAVPVREGPRQVVVPAAVLKLVLRAIDDHGRRCFCSQQTLAAETGLSERTVRRAIVALETLGVLCVELQWTPAVRKTVNHLVIVWSELELLANASQASPQPHDRSATDPRPFGHGDTTVRPRTPDRSATARDRSATGGRQSAQGSVQETATTEAGEWEAVVDVLGRLGIRNAWQTCHSAKSHGIRVDRAHQLISQWQSLRDPHADTQAVDRELGVLVWALRSATPRQVEEHPKRCFPTAFVASAAARTAAERRRLEAAQRAQVAHLAESRQAEQSATIESTWGPVYDDATQAQRLAWIADNQFLAERLRRDPSSPIVRTAVLAVLSRQAAAAAGPVATPIAAAQGVGR